MFKTSSKLLVASLCAVIVACLGFMVWAGHNDASEWAKTMAGIWR